MKLNKTQTAMKKAAMRLLWRSRRADQTLKSSIRTRDHFGYATFTARSHAFREAALILADEAGLGYYIMHTRGGRS